MAPASQLERINKLAERLTPLANKSRGMKVEADEWNALVNTLSDALDIERVQEGSVATTLDENYARREHQHRGEVTIEWLDADLQSRLEGGSNSVSFRTTFMELGKKVESLATEVARLNTVVAEQQRKLDEAAVREADRTKLLRGFDERFSAVESLRTQFNTMSSQFQGLNQNVATVLELRKRLSDATGKPFDLDDLNRRLTDIQKFADSQRGSDNKPLNFRDLDLRLRGVEDVTDVGGGGGLGARLNALTADVETRFNTKLDERITATRNSLAQEHEERATRLKESLDAGLENVRGEASRLVDTQLKASQTTLSAQLDERLRATGETLRRDVTASAVARVESRFGELDIPGKIKSNVDATRGDIETSLRSQLGESLKGTVTASIADVEQRLTTRVAATEGVVARTNQDLPARVRAEVAGATASLSADVDKRVGEGLSKIPELLEPTISTKVEAAIGSTAARLSTQVDTLVQQRVGNINESVRVAVSNELKTLPTVVSGEVESRFSALKLNEQLTQMRGSLETNLSTQLNQSVADLRAKVTTTDAAVNDLRGQVAVTQRTAAEAQTRTVTLEGKLADTSRDFDAKLNTVNTRATTGAATTLNTTRIVR